MFKLIKLLFLILVFVFVFQKISAIHHHKKIECRNFSSFENFFKFYEKSEFNEIFTFYPSIGYELDYLNLHFKKYNVNLNFIYDNFDKLCWEYASSGFFKFKSQIPHFISKIN